MKKLNLQALNALTQQPVFWVVLSLALVITPHLQRFPVWSIILIYVLFIWRLICIKKTHCLPPRWLLAILSMLSAIGIFIYFGSIFGKTAGSVLLSVLLAIKLHESTTKRDYMLLTGLSFFIIVTNFLFSQSIPDIVFMLAVIIVLIVSMITINQGATRINIKDKFKLSLKMLLQAIPLMLIMFVLFPRISGPLWQLPDEKPSAISGLSDSMSPGNISNLIRSNATAFRVEFDHQIPPQNKLYWRTLVLWNFDGRTWKQGDHNLNYPATLYSNSSRVVDYTITMEPQNNNRLYALDMPMNVPDSVNYTGNYVLRSQHKIVNLYQYHITSVTDYNIRLTLIPWEQTAGLKIPENTNPKTIQMGKELALKYKRPDNIIKYVLKQFNQQNFHYTLRPPLTPGFHPVDQFLFESKRGFCEHYTSSFTLLMRAAGIPARVIMGYQGGTLNPLNNIMTVRQSDAHAWSEVWLKNRGWVRIDPTAAIAPQRIERNLNAALDPNESRPFHMQINSGIIRDILFYWDAIDNQWNQWIVGYDRELQKQFLESLLDKKINYSEIILLMVISFSIMLIIISLFIMKPWQHQKTDPVVKLYNDFCAKLARRDILREPYEGPLDYAARAIEKIPAQKSSIQLISRLYIKLRYEASHSEKQFEQLRLHIRKFKPGR